MPRILVTRPTDDAAPLVVRLRELGIDSIVSPILEINLIDGPDVDLSGVQGVVLTSVNGVRALAHRTRRRDMPCYAVGDATARQAATCGFTSIQSASGDIDDLARLISAHCDPDAGALLHATGSVTAGDLAAMLAPKNFSVRRKMLYDAKTVQTLPPEAEKALQGAALDGVVLFSPRTARHFTNLVAKAGLSAALGRLTLFALSENVDNAAGDVWGKRIIARHPDQETLLQAVRTCYY